MEPAMMDRLIAAHVAAEAAGDPAGAVAVYTDDTEQMVPTRRYYGQDFCVIEHQWIGTVPGTFLGVPGHGRRIAFRLLHAWEFRDGRIRRENVWLDGGSIVAQLTAPAEIGAAGRT